MNSLSFIISVLLFVFIAIPVKSQPGRLDKSFGNQGVVIFSATSQREMAYDVCVQSDGKIVQAGLQGDVGTLNFFVARYLEDGSVDTDFGNNGTSLVDFGGIASEVWAIVLQDDGKILLGGSASHPWPVSDNFAIARLNTDGTLDLSFGIDGIRSIDVDQGWDWTYGIALQDNGMIILAGDGYTNERRNACAVRFSSDGFLDKGFGSGGIALNPVGTEDDKTKDMALQEDGKVLMCGYIDDGLDNQTFVIRLNTDGTLDETFGNNGKVTLDIGGNDDRLFKICVLGDGKILAGGFTQNSSNQNDYLLLRYLSNGTLDNTFGSNGIKMHNFNSTDIVSDMVLQPDGKILIAGGGFSFELVRCLEDGSLDMSFGTDGRVITQINTNCVNEGIALYDEGSVILSGYSKSDGEYNFTLAKYLLDDNEGIADQEAAFKNISIYPNPPVGNQISLEYILNTDEEINIDLLTISGQFLDNLLENQTRKAGQHKETLVLPGELSAGIYLLRLTSSHGSAVVKFEVH